MKYNYLRDYNDHTRDLSDSELRTAARIADYKDREFQRNHGCGDWNTFFNKAAREMRFNKPVYRSMMKRWK